MQSLTQDPTVKNNSISWPSARSGWYAVFVLSLSLLVNFLDRGIITLLVPQLKADLQLSDTEMSLIMGFAFVLFYMVAGLPIARYADHGRRTRLIAIGLGLWGGATALCGLSKSFMSLFAFRVGVGVGEACTGPATYSLLGDYFPPNKLPRAIAVLNFGFIAGNGLAILIGGTLIAMLLNMGSISLPFIGELRVWQLAFMLVGIPGLLVALLMLTVPEPPRRILGDPPSVNAVILFLKEKRWVYGPLIIGIALNTIVSVGIMSWGPAFYMRTFDWPIEKVAIVSGSLTLLIMPVGAFLGSTLAEKWANAGRADANLRVVLLALTCSFPFMVAFPLMPTGMLAAGVWGVGMFFTSLLFGPQNAAIQLVTPNRMRGQITAVVLFGFNVIGFGLGPTVLAVMTDQVFQDEMQIGYAMATTTALLSPIALIVLLLGLKPYTRAVVEIQTNEKSGA